MSNGAAIVRAATVASSATLAFHPLDSATSDWERLVATSPEARLYHRPYWIDALQRSYGFPIFVASFRAGADLLASCVLARSLTPWNQRLVALPFSDRCEPLAVDDGALDALLVALARSCSTIPCELRGIAGPPPWQTNNSFINWDLDLSVTTRRLEQKLSANFRRNLVSASRLGVTIERGRTVRDLQRFIALNAVSRRRLGVPSQPARFFHNLWEAAHDRNAAEIWIAAHSGKDLAAVFLLLDGETAYYKWSARSLSETRGAGHLLVWSIVESLRGNYRTLDLGRTDARNEGLNRFKRELGGTHSPLPYSFVPHAPTEISPEHVHGSRRLIAAIWKHLPPAVCGLLGGRLYKYLA